MSELTAASRAKLALLVPVVFVPMGLAALCLGAYLCVLNLEILNRPRAEGIVIENQLKVGGRPSWSPLFRFSDNQGRDFTVKSRTSSNPPSFSVGEKVLVAYRPDDPSQAEIVTFGVLWPVPISACLFGIVFIAIGLFIFVSMRGTLLGNAHRSLSQSGAIREESTDATKLSVRFSLCASLIGLLALSSPAHAEDWPRWGGPRGDGTWRGPKLREAWPKEGLPVVLKKPIGGGYGGVSVVGSRVYVQDRVTAPVEQERLLCFDARSGDLLWQHFDAVAYGKLDYGNGPRAAPTVHDGRVYTLGAVGRFCCVSAETGELHWTKDLVADFGAVVPTWGLAASPLIWNDLVIVHPGAANGGCVIAFDRLTGNEVWRSGSDPAGYATPVVINAPSGPQLVCWSPENVLGIEPQTGRPLWSIPYKVTYGVSISPPIYYENTLLVTGYWEGAKAIRLGKNADEATLVWEENRFLRALMAQPIYRDGLVYMIDKTHGLTCFVLETGEKLWDDGHRSTPRGRNPHASLVWLEDGDRALLLNELGDLILARLNREGYHELARANIIERKENSPIWAHPAYAGKFVFARSDSEIVCVELPVNEERPREDP